VRDGRKIVSIQLWSLSSVIIWVELQPAINMYKPGGTMVRDVKRKAISLQIHNLAQKKYPAQPTQVFSVVSLHGMALVGPLCREW
jgi:hypothetical protein